MPVSETSHGSPLVQHAASPSVGTRGSGSEFDVALASAVTRLRTKLESLLESEQTRRGSSPNTAQPDHRGVAARGAWQCARRRGSRVLLEEGPRQGQGRTRPERAKLECALPFHSTIFGDRCVTHPGLSPGFPKALSEKMALGSDERSRNVNEPQGATKIWLARAPGPILWADFPSMWTYGPTAVWMRG